MSIKTERPLAETAPRRARFGSLSLAIEIAIRSVHAEGEGVRFVVLLLAHGYHRLVATRPFPLPTSHDGKQNGFDSPRSCIYK